MSGQRGLGYSSSFLRWPGAKMKQRHPSCLSFAQSFPVNIPTAQKIQGYTYHALIHAISCSTLCLVVQIDMIAPRSRANIFQRLSQSGVLLPFTVSRVHTVNAIRPFTTGLRAMKSNGTTPSPSRSDRRNLQITESQDDAAIRSKYRPFLLDERVAQSDWISKLELDSVEDMVQADLATNGDRLRVLVIYGSLRARYCVFPYVQSHSH
jgi:hypothetical protein